jgi:hypothetical protein
MHKQGQNDAKPRRNLLKDVEIKEVSFVGRGANEGARQSLFKIADTEDLAKRLFAEVMGDMQATKAAQKLLYEICEAVGYLKQALAEITHDSDMTEKKEAFRQSIQQFAAVAASMVDDSELQKEFIGIAKEAFNNAKPEDFALVADINDRMSWRYCLTTSPGGEFEKGLADLALPYFGESRTSDRFTLEEVSDTVDSFAKVWGENLPDELNTIKEDLIMSKELEQLQKKNEEQEAQIAKLTFLAGLTDVEKKHYGDLDDKGKEAFEKMDSDQRQASIDEAIAKAAAADDSFEMDGETIKKSEVGAAVFAVMKAQQQRLEKAEANAEAERQARVAKELQSEAEQMFPHLEGTPEEKAEMLKGIRALPKEQQDKQIKMLKSADSAMAKAFTELGQEGGEDLDGATAKLNKLAKEHAAANNVTFHKAYDAILKTDEGKKLYAETLK